MTANRPTQPPKANSTPAFEFEDGSPATPAAPSAPAPAPSFNPFADQVVSTPLETSAPLADEPDRTPTTKPGTGKIPGKPASAKSPAASSNPPSIAPIASVQIGSASEDATAGRDLWKCPHCGAGNQKKRTTCRVCGKGPDEPVQVSFVKTPVGMGVIALAVVIVLFLGWRLTRTDKSFHAPASASVDAAPRTWGMTDKDFEVGPNRLFNQRGEASVCGRVISAKAITGYDWITTVVLALGPEAASEAFSSWSAPIVNNETEITSNAPSYVVVHCIFDGEAPALKQGMYLSLSGMRGNIQESASLVPYTNKPGHLCMKVAKFEIGDGK